MKTKFSQYIAEANAYRSLEVIAREIKKDWKNVSPYAKPYLDAMSQLDEIGDKYGADDAKGIVLYFLSNAASWKGEVAKKIKVELKAMAAGKKVAEALEVTQIFDFSTREEADELLDWLTKKGFDDFSEKDIYRGSSGSMKNRFAINLLPQYKHEADKIQAQVVAIKTKHHPYKESLTEAKDVFPDVDVIKLDPDRADSYDVASAIMPTLVRMAYTNLYHEKTKYDRSHTDEEDTPFDFTISALEDELDDLIKHVRNRLDDQSSHDKKAYIKRLESEFTEKLQ